MSLSTEEKLSKLKKIISELESVVVAFSGGVDSTLVAKICYDVLKENSMAVTARSETYPDFEFKDAQNLAKEIGIKHLVIDTSELAIEGFANNPYDILKTIEFQHPIADLICYRVLKFYRF